MGDDVWEGRLDVYDTGIRLIATVEKWGIEKEVSVDLRDLLEPFDGEIVRILVTTAKPLRICKDCGREARSEKDLENFVAQQTAKHGRLNPLQEMSEDA